MSEELSLSFEEHKDFVDNSGDLMQSVALDGRFRYVNHAWLRILGYSRPQISKMTFFDVIHPDEIEHCQELFMRVMSGEDVGLVTTTFVTKKGQLIYVEGNVNCKLVGGRPVYTRAIFRDITERKQAEEEIRKFKTISDNAGYGTAIASIEGEFLYLNEAYAQMHGYTIDELIGKHHSILYTEESLQTLEKFRHKLVQEGRFFAEELWRRRKDNTIFPSLTTAGVVKDDQGNPLYTAATVSDITERKQVEEKLESSEVRLRSIIETANDAIIVSDSNGDIVSWNQAAVNIFGYSYDEIIGKSVTTIMPSRFREAHRQGMKRVTTTGEVHVIGSTVEVVGLRKDETEVPIELSLARWGVKEGQFFAAIIRDITERKRAEERLKESEEKYRTLTESSLTSIFIHQDEKYVFVNDRFARMLGYTIQELLGKNHLAFYDPDDREGIRHIAAKRLLGRAVPQHYEVRRVKKDGKTIWCENRSTRIEYMGKPAIMGNVVDITERKRIEDALRESEERYRTLLELSGEIGEAVVMLQDTDDKKAVHAFATGEWSRITGYSMEELLGMSWFELLHPDYREEALERYQRRIGGETFPGLFEAPIVRKDGAEVPVEITAGPTTYRGKSGLVIYARDITGPKKAAQEREKLILELQETLAEVKTLSGLLPICAWCKKFRDDEGYWKSVEDYLGEQTGAEFTHGICPECSAKFFDRG